MGRTSWEGWQAESWTPRTIDPERAPAEIQFAAARISSVTKRGVRSGPILTSAPPRHPSHPVSPLANPVLLSQDHFTNVSRIPGTNRKNSNRNRLDG